jgi:hypothetical protein
VFQNLPLAGLFSVRCWVISVFVRDGSHARRHKHSDPASRRGVGSVPLGSFSDLVK